jgi:exosome complex RNA-binding protein Rrp4
LLKILTVKAPRDIMIGSNGILYVSSEHLIFTISTDYVVKPFAGSMAGFSDGNRLTHTFNEPRGH